jgi:hypothetical protein
VILILSLSIVVILFYYLEYSSDTDFVRLSDVVILFISRELLW